MYCKDCRYYSDKGGAYIDTSLCANEKLSENYGQKLEGDELIYPYNEGACFSPQPNFGCIHFEKKE